MNILAKLTDWPEFTPQAQQDFFKRYQGTCMLLEGQPALIGGMLDSNNFIITHKGKARGFDIQTEDTETDLQPFLPEVGYYNTSEYGVIYLKKVPQRQWHRSFSRSIYHASGPHLKASGFDIGRNSLPIARNLINSQYIGLDDINHPLLHKAALDKEFCVGSHNDTIFLFYKRFPVGVLNFNNKTIRCIQPILEQELIDFFKKKRIVKWKLQTTATK